MVGGCSQGCSCVHVSGRTGSAQRTRSSDPPSYPVSADDRAPGWSELPPAPLPFTFITGVGAGVPDSWSELSTGGGKGGIGTEVACNCGPMLLSYSVLGGTLDCRDGQLMEGGLVCWCWSLPTSPQWSPRSGAGQRTHRRQGQNTPGCFTRLTDTTFWSLRTLLHWQIALLNVGPTTLVAFFCVVGPLLWLM